MKINKDLSYLVVIILLLAQIFQQQLTPSTPTDYTRPEVYYNKTTALNQKLIEQILEAQEFVYFGIYTFTRYDIKDALIGARLRGVKVMGITDKEQIEKIPNQAKLIAQLKDADIPVYVQTHSYIMHLKVLVTEKTYASGSYNWTANATDKNDEVLEIGSDPATRNKYQEILEELFKRSVELK